MFLHYLVSLDEKELLAKVYSTQKANPLKNDWCLQVQSDMREFKLEMTDEELKALSKEKVKTACREAAFLFLKKE